MSEKVNTNANRDEKLDTASEAASVPSDEVSLEQEERRLVRKLDMRILPVTCLLYLLAYLDRSNLGNARLQGLTDDILGGDKTGILFDWINSIFFFSYIICQTPATVLSKLVPPRIWMFGAALGWGIASTSMAGAHSFGAMMTSRLFLGVFEAAFGPAIPIYFSLFYTKSEMGLRIAYWFGFAAVAGAFGGLLAFGIQHIHTSIAQWRLLFIIEGTPTIVLAFLTLLLLPNRPESTSFLNERERAIAMERMNRATSADHGAVVNKAHIRLAFKDWRVYVGGIVYFGLNCALASISAFLPTILTTLGFASTKAQLLTVPPYAVAAAVLIGFSFLSDRYQTRGPFMVISQLIGAIGYILLLTVRHNNHVRYFATFCITSGTYAAIGLMVAWFAHNLGSETKKATGIPMFMAIGQCGSILGSHIYPNTQKPYFVTGFAVTGALELLGAMCALILTVSYQRENARRDALYGKPEENARVDTHELADGAPAFRYIP